MRTKLARWRLSLEIALWRYGTVWPLLVLCLVLAGGVWFGTVQAQRQVLVDLSQRAADQQRRQHQARPVAPPQDAQAQTWQQIRQTWPSTGQIDTEIASVLQAAQKRGLLVEQGDYQYRFEPELNALRVTMNLPLRGSYTHVRQWVDAVLRDHPNVALEELAIKREAVASAEAEVKARWVAWYRADETQPATSMKAPQTEAQPLSPAATRSSAEVTR